MFGSRSPHYEKVAHSDTEAGEEAPRQLKKSFISRSTTYFNFGFFVVNTIIFVTTLWANGRKGANWALKQTNYDTPLLDQFTFKMTDVKQNASLFNDPFTIYKADPSPEVDAAWDAIADTPVLVFSKEDIVRIGKDPEYTTSVPEEFGYGTDKYFGVMDGQHLIHCLDELRRFAHYDYYYREKWGDMSNIPPMHAAHRSHCIGVLLNALTCQPSLNIVTWTWMEDQPEPFPDFNAWRKCQNTDELFEWIDKRQVSRQSIKDWNWKRPEGQKEIPVLPQLKEEKGKGEKNTQTWAWHTIMGKDIHTTLSERS